MTAPRVGSVNRGLRQTKEPHCEPCPRGEIDEETSQRSNYLVGSRQAAGVLMLSRKRSERWSWASGCECLQDLLRARSNTLINEWLYRVWTKQGAPVGQQWLTYGSPNPTIFPSQLHHIKSPSSTFSRPSVSTETFG